HRVLGDQRGLGDLVFACAEQPCGLRVEVAAVPTAGGAGDGEADQLLVFVRDGGLVGQLQALEARPLRGHQVVRYAPEELRDEAEGGLDVAVDVSAGLGNHQNFLGCRTDLHRR